MLIKIKNDPSIQLGELTRIQRACKAAQSMARQRRYLRLARYEPRMRRFMLALWHQERTYWAHILGLTDERQPATNARRV